MADQEAAAETADPMEAAEAILADMGIGRDEGEESAEEAPPADETESSEEETHEGEEAEAAEEDSEEETEAKEKSEPEEWAKTPEGITAKAKELQQQEAEIQKRLIDMDRFGAGLDRKKAKISKQADRLKRESTEFHAMRDWVTTNINALRNGDASTRIQALGALTGKPGHEMYEELSMGLIADGGSPKETQELRELRQQVSQMSEYIRAQQQQGQQANTHQRIQQWRAHVVEVAKSEATPLTARLATEDPSFLADQAAGIAEIFYRQNGQPIDPAQIPGILEKRLAIVAGAQSPSQPSGNGATPQGVTERDPVASSAKPEQAQRPPKGQSIPQSTGSSARKRVLTEQERLKAAEDLLPDWVDRFART